MTFIGMLVSALNGAAEDGTSPTGANTTVFD